MHRAIKQLRFNALTIPRRPFYRRYPYGGGVSATSADDRGLVDMELGVFCNRIPKAANSTVVENLARLRFGRHVPSKQAKRRFRSPAELSRSEMAEFDRLFKFVIVRNPFTRTLSAYLDKVERKALRRNREVSFEGFLGELETGALYSNAHWAPQSSLLLLPLDAFDVIGRTENLEADLTAVLERLAGGPLDWPVVSFRGNASGASEKLARYYRSPETVERVRSLFSDDFRLFGYSTELPI